MEYINTRPLTYMVHRIKHSSRVAAVFAEINESCHLGLKFQYPQTVLATAKRINEREVREKKYRPLPDRKNFNWVFGEFKIFIWTVIYKCLIKRLQIQELSMDFIREIQCIFRSKSIYFIQYEIQLLIDKKYDLASDEWNPEQLVLLAEIMRQANEKGEVNWRGISFQLFQLSEGRFFRNINHCRQKWFNHVNPQVKKGQWATEEDIRIFTLIKKHGLKWSMISREMGKTRTEHMVKNRFNRYYRQWRLTKETSIQTIYTLFQENILKPYLRNKRCQYFGEQNENIKTQEVEQQWVQAMMNISMQQSSPPQPQYCLQENQGMRTAKGEAREDIDKPQSQIMHGSNDQAKIAHSPQILKEEQRLSNEKFSQNHKEETIKIQTDPLKQQPILCQEKKLQFLGDWNFYPFMNLYYSKAFPFHF